MKLLLLALALSCAAAAETAGPAGKWNSMNRRTTSAVRKNGVLELEIKAAQKFHGGAALTIPEPEQNKDFVFSAVVTATEPETAYLSVKLYKGKKEIRRFISQQNASTGAMPLSIKFNTGDADKIELLVRTIQIQDTVGAKIAVRDIDLRPAGE
jgi:hypothetical protein